MSKNNKLDKISVSILGSRGIPAHYSGFETAIQEIAIRLKSRGMYITVYCRNSYFVKKNPEFQGVKLKYLPSIRTKHLETLSHTLLSAIHSIFNKCDVIILFGVGNALFTLLYKIFSIPVIAVVDGADWKRKKWNRFSKTFLKLSFKLCARFSTIYVVDSRLLQVKYSKTMTNSPVYIPYGSKESENQNESLLNKYGLQKREYVIFIGRFEQEKGIEFLIRNYNDLPTDCKLVLVGGNDMNPEYETKLKKLAQDDKIVFLGFIYGEDYEALLAYALFYVTCSLLEGTSPSLLAAMSLNGFALTSDIEENLETLKGSCDSFKSGDDRDFREKILYYINNPNLVESQRACTKKIVRLHYNWNLITDQYEKLIKSVDN